MDPTTITRLFRFSLDEPKARRWLAHAIAREEGCEASESVLSDEQARDLADLDALCRLEGGRIGPERADELDFLRAMHLVDELRAEEPELAAHKMLPQIGLNYRPCTVDDADPTDELVSYACESGMLPGSGHIDFGFSYNPSGDSGYWWHISLMVPGDHHRLNLTSVYFDLQDIAPVEERGLDAAISVLNEAVRVANETIEGLPDFLRAVDDSAARASTGEEQDDHDRP